MSKRLSFLVAAFLAGSSASAFAATSCDVNPSTPVYSPDDNAISIIFDNFFAEPSIPANCNLAIAANKNTKADPDTFGVYKADYIGFVDAGETAHFKVRHNGVTEEGDVVGLKDVGDSYYQHFIGKGDDGKLTSQMTLSQDEGFGTVIDTLDYTLQATMTRDDAETSLTNLSLSQGALVTHLEATSGLLTGGNMALEGPNEVRVLGGLGSYMLGGNLRYNLSDGFSVLAGISIIDQSAGGASYHGGLGAIAVRYVEPAGAAQRFFAEGGIDAAALSMSFTRTYTDSTGTQTVTGSGTGGLGALYVKGGMMFTLDDSNEVALSATAKQSFLGLSDYREAFSGSNMFAADLSGTTVGFTTLKLGADWTTALAADLDLTAHLGGGTTMANQGTTAVVFGGGTTTGTGATTLFAEYGLGLGWHVTPTSTIEGFVQGSTGTGIGTHAQVGAAYKLQF